MPRKTKKTIKKAAKRFVAERPKTQGKENRFSSSPSRATAKGEEGIKKTKIRVIGIGGGGGSIVSELASKMKKASFVVANTDLQALKTTGRKVGRFHFGQSFTHGLGTGMNADLGKEAAQNEKDKIKKLLEGQDLCILVVSLGGGTGSGAAPVFAKIAKALGNLTYGIFTLPFKFEGEKKMEIAGDSLKKIKNYLNAITIIPNERVFRIIDKETPLKEALSIINKILSESLGGLIETIYEPGLINIDFADFRTILQGQGRLAYLNTVEVRRKEGSTEDLTAKVLNSPLYPYSIRGAKGVLFNIVGEKGLSLSEVNQISKTISELANPEAKIIFGISQSQKYSDTIKTTLLATGCGLRLFSSKAKKKAAKKEKETIGKTSSKKEKTDLLPKAGGRQKEKEKAVKLKRKKIKKPKKSKPRSKQASSGTRAAEKGEEEDLSSSPTAKRVKIEVTKASGERLSPESGAEEQQFPASNVSEGMVRKNALQIKKEAEEAEREMLEREKFWETPAFLRKKLAKE